MQKHQNIFDNKTFFNEYKALREREDNYNDLLEQPAMAKLLPELAGKAVLDLGCGFGHNCLDFVKRGAARVVGVDISQKMLEIANNECAHEKITYINMSMTDISAINEKFDLIYSSLAFHYVQDFEALIRDAFSALNSGGYLLFSQEHPIVTASADGEGHFNRNEKGEKISYNFSNYNQPGERKSTWYVDGVIKYHRTMGNIITTLAKAGFVIDTVAEPLPEEWAIEKRPGFAGEFIKPTFLIVKAKKL